MKVVGSGRDSGTGSAACGLAAAAFLAAETASDEPSAAVAPAPPRVA